MKLSRFSLRLRIFFAMILLVLLASILIAAVTIFQYNEEAKAYHNERLDRKEENIRSSIDYTIKETTYPVTSEKIPLIFKVKIYEIAAIHNMEISLYDLEGGLLRSSETGFQVDSLSQCLDASILNTISHSLDRRYVHKSVQNGENYLSSYSIITDKRFKPLAILNLHYLENDDFLNIELRNFLVRLGYAYFIMLIIAIGLAYLLSKYITKSIKKISDKMNETRFVTHNKKIDIGSTSEEIAILVNSYNSMIDELEASAVKLATSEREQAWREMAKQVAHEIKNPLTPMRLSVQSFQRKFDPQDPNILLKVDEYSETLIQQIDTMSSIASAFSNFAEMPAQQNEMLNVVSIVKLALDIFNEDYIVFVAEKKEVIAKFDRTQLIRVVTNLVKNGIQAIPDDGSRTPKIVVEVRDDNNYVSIIVTDNGKGISEENKVKIFEPKFTTKSSGMGLGLGMVKNIVETYTGNITFTSQLNEGTTFTVAIPKK
ncbi:GHKL domain-containing protein [Bizionia argentinensis JUB59]|uniref:histidine kinase n=1 Tax=Bizionia argentinensis JUB59 TaxID=1046627 RepID=G2EF08_9FLAO|nr:ATP-binding protein [Bizionia argentinensis]EGV43063.2 GHKL domain-containing protein [Bizionia argentinensis JUB59]